LSAILLKSVNASKRSSPIANPTAGVDEAP